MNGTRSQEPFQPRIKTAPLFVETLGFSEDWHNLDYDDDDLLLLQGRIMAWPKAAPVIPGTGGLRKLRFVAPKQRQGKRGATRVGYVYFEHSDIVLLVIAYAKTAQRDVLHGQKKAIRQMIVLYEKQLASNRTQTP